MRTIFFLILMVLIGGDAFAQKRDAYNPNEAPPSVEEYKNIPKGVMMPESFHMGKETTSEIKRNEALAPTMTLQEIRAAYRAGKYDMIAVRVATLAENDHPEAQELLGIMYRSGQGVQKNLENAIKWLRKAADLNRPLAQHHLGTLYFTGEGVRQDPVTALMWLHLAALYYPEGAEKTRALQDRDSIKSQISRRDRDRAFEMAKAWLSKKGEDHLLKAE